MNQLVNTPYYTYNLNKIEENYQNFQSAIPGVMVRYAVKSNPMKEVVETLAKLGSGFEIASKIELAMLLARDVDPRQIFFSNPVKNPIDIEYAYKKGVRVFAYDSLEEIDKLSQYAPGCQVILRLRVYERGSVFSLKYKFGAEERQAVKLAKQAQTAGLVFHGLSFHVGSQSLKLNTWKYALEKIVRIQAQLRDNGIEVAALNLGGGFPYTYRRMKAPTIRQIASIIKPYLKKLEIPDIYAEPGRYLVANAATLTVSVIHRTVRRGDTWLYLDAGAYNALFEAMNFQGNIQYEVHAMDRRTSKKQKYILAGPTCDSIDMITEDVRLPEDLKIGDRLVFEDVGAYTNALANSFNGFKQPKIHLD